MKRDLRRLADEEFDLLVVGAGIYGACAARDAALRGLKTAVIDRGDFGSATSQNSLKTIHGGLRYLQQADLIRMRESIRERRILTRIAPQFVHPLPCVMPTYGHFTKGREALAVAMLLNDLIAFDRNRDADPSKRLPRGRTISRRRLLELLPGIPEKGLTGGAIWYDCQTHNSERLLLSFILSAAGRREAGGAAAANYVGAEQFLVRGSRVEGVAVRDTATGERFDIRARVVINAAGPWAMPLASRLETLRPVPPVRLASALNLVVRGFVGGYAAGLSCRPDLIEEDAYVRRGSRLYFVAPWRGVTLAGTAYAPYDGDPDDFRVTEGDIASLLAEINKAYPAARLSREDVRSFHGGLLPMKGVSARTGEPDLLKHYRLIDHARVNGVGGLISILGVKYTTARDVAEKAVDLAIRQLGGPARRSMSHETPVHGGNIRRFDEFLSGALSTRPTTVSEESMTHLVYHYGSEYRDIIRYTDRDPSLARPLPGQRYVIEAEVVHAAREEMALHLADVLLRRTELGSAGHPGDECAGACAEIMGRELGWSAERKAEELRTYTAACGSNPKSQIPKHKEAGNSGGGA